MKNLVSFLRKYPHLVKVPLCLDLYRYTLLPHPSKFTRRTTFKFLNHNDTGCAFYSFLRKFTKEVKHLQVVPFYSNRNTFEVEAPTGIFKEAQNSFHLDSLKGCLGQSFNQLSRHIKVYFKGVVPENACLTTQEYLGRSQRRSQSRWADREQNTSKAKCTDKQDSSGTSPSALKNSGLQLFHISSLVTRFGENYSYVAHHINSIFSLELEKVKIQENLKSMPSTRGKNRGQKRRKMQNTAQFGAEQAPLESNNISSSWEQGYCHFPRHTNKCFHANFENKVQSRREQLQKEENSMYKNHFSTQPTSQTQGASSQLKQEEPIIPEPEGLFHSRHGTTNFGENHFQMASHINQYFKGQRGPSEEIDRNLLKEMGPGSATSERLKTVTIMDCLRHPTSAIPDLLGGYLKLGPLTRTGEPKPAITSLEAILNKKVSWGYTFSAVTLIKSMRSWKYKNELVFSLDRCTVCSLWVIFSRLFSGCLESEAGRENDTCADCQSGTSFISRSSDYLHRITQRTPHPLPFMQSFNVAGLLEVKQCKVLKLYKLFLL